MRVLAAAGLTRGIAFDTVCAHNGRVPEWSKGADCKSVERKPVVGSNPTAAFFTEQHRLSLDIGAVFVFGFFYPVLYPESLETPIRVCSLRRVVHDQR